MNKNLFFLLGIGLLFTACGPSKPECKFDPPVALFTEAHPEVKSQSFEIEGMRAVESVEFVKPIQLELLQDGCETTEQDFRFTIDNVPDQPDEYWIVQTISCFRYMVSASDKLGPTGQQLINALQAAAPDLKLGQRLPLAPGFFIRVDKVDSGDKCILSANFSEGI
ncbi:MAG: hypothetical protein AAF598_18835 [Bacteroidota bacterium]